MNFLKRNRESILNSKKDIFPERVTKVDDVKSKQIDEEEMIPKVKSNEMMINDILNTLPKSNRKEAAQILRFMESQPGNLTWNENKELIY